MKTLRLLLDQLKSDRRGGPLAEMALAVPIILLLLFGTMEFGSLLYQQHTITKGVQEAARYAARAPALREGDACPPDGDSWDEIVARAQDIATLNGTEGDALMPNFEAEDVAVEVRCQDAEGLSTPVPGSDSIPIVRVSASVEARSLGFLALLNLEAINLTASHEEMGIGL